MKKKMWMAVLAGVLAVSLSACSGSAAKTTEAETTNTEATTAVTNGEAVAETVTAAESAVQESETPVHETEDNHTAGGNSLIVYFSWSGNTESVAKEIQGQTGADVFKLVPEEPYTDDYNELLEIAQDEQRNDARPAFSGEIETMDDYEVVYVGFPNWWGDMPMILYSFFDAYDLSGKTIVPFVTSGGSGFSGTISTMQSLEPEAQVVDGLSLGSQTAGNPGSQVSEWLGGLGLAE
ncbi:MAG: flavodoxin [Clostridium sp.]|nr:flavodoxin [Clostridium sp.]